MWFVLFYRLFCSIKSYQAKLKVLYVHGGGKFDNFANFILFPRLWTEKFISYRFSKHSSRFVFGRVCCKFVYCILDTFQEALNGFPDILINKRLVRLRQLHSEYIWKSLDASGSTVLYCPILRYCGLYGTLLVGNFKTNSISFSILTMNQILKEFW